MTLQSNKQAMKYSLQGERVPIYETDENGNIIYYEDSDGNKIPIIIYSNSVPKDVLIKVLSLGPRTYLIKPLKPNVLVRKCLNYLQTKY